LFGENIQRKEKTLIQTMGIKTVEARGTKENRTIVEKVFINFEKKFLQEKENVKIVGQ
jgi:hypothetical protein